MRGNPAMASGSQQDERYSVQTENRHLKETVTALRDEMDNMRVSEQERLQHTLAAAREEIGQLKATITALRDGLERRKIEDEEKSRTIDQAARDEAKQLHDMIRLMRDKLEAYEKK